jgi:hypothetical protein
MELSRLAFFFGLVNPMHDGMSLAAESQLFARLESELELEVPSIPDPATQPQWQSAEDDVVGRMIAPAAAPAPHEVRPIAVQIGEYRQERSAPPSQGFQSIAWERKLDTWQT